MNALNQYIDLFESNRNLIDSRSVSLLNSKREEASEILKKIGLPAKGRENYETTDLNNILSPDYGLNLARVNIDVNPAASFRCNVPNISTSLFLLINDAFFKTENSEKGLPDGVIICSLRHAAENHSELVKKYYGSIADKANPLVSLNDMLVQDGLFIYVPKGVKVLKPIQLVNITSNGAPLMNVRRMLIIVEDNAEVTLLSCDHTQIPDINYLNLHTIEISVGRNATLNFYDLEESTTNTNRLSSLYLNQKGDSRVVIDGITLYNGLTRNEYYCSFEGVGSELKLMGLGIEDGERHLDTYSYISHSAKDCRSNELFKYVVDDSASGAFTGRIYVAPGSSKTEAYQSNRNIVSSDNARMYAKPQLEIYNDDVKCSHGTAIGQLDEMQLFYMQTRGIPLDNAKLLLKQAFLMDVVDAVGLPQLKDRLRHLIDNRFEGRQSTCSDCGICS